MLYSWPELESHKLLGIASCIRIASLRAVPILAQIIATARYTVPMSFALVDQSQRSLVLIVLLCATAVGIICRYIYQSCSTAT